MVADIQRMVPQLLHEFTNKVAVVQRELGFCQVHICGKEAGCVSISLGQPNRGYVPVSWNTESVFLWTSLHGSPGSLEVVSG